MFKKTDSIPANGPLVMKRWNGPFLQMLDRTASVLDSYPWSLMAVLLLLYIHIAIHERNYPLWYDELYTYYIAQASSFKQMLLWTRQVDLNPPLYYILARLSIHIFHPSKLAVRLPSLIAYFVASLCAYQFVRRRLTPLYGSIASLILLSPSYNYFSHEARPYALVLGFLGIASLGWQGATERGSRKRFLSLSLLTIGGFGMLLSHVLALVAYASLFLAEFVRFMIRRKADWPLWISLVLPLSSCILYLPLIHQHSAGVYPPVLQASIQALFDDYSNLWIDIAPFLAVAMLLIAFIGIKPRLESQSQHRLHINWPEIAFTIGLLLVPAIIILRFMVTHSQFFPRYGLSGVFGAAILVPYFIAWWTDNSRRAALISVTVFIISVLHPYYIARVLQAHLQPNSGARTLSREITQPLTQIQPDLPFVDADGLTFLEMDNRENSDFLSRVYYLVDPEAALQYAHANGFNGLQSLQHIFPIRARVETYDEFIKRYPKFIVFGTYDTPDDWLIPKLLADGADVRFLGEIPSMYKDHNLYEVTVEPKSAQ